MKFYHGTSFEAWWRIKKDKRLWGVPIVSDALGVHSPNYKNRHTHLSSAREVAAKFGNILLEVEYKPVGNRDSDGKLRVKPIDNYGFEPPPGDSLACGGGNARMR